MAPQSFYVTLKVILFSALCGFLSACADYGTVPLENLDTPVINNAPEQAVPTKSTTALTKVSLMVPLQGDFAKAGQAVRNGYLNAYYQANASQTQGLTIVNSQAGMNILSLYQQALKVNDPALVVGPLTKADTSVLAKEVLLTAPVLALNRVDAEASVPANFYQFSLDPQAEARLVAQRMRHDGYQQVYVVAPIGDWGQSIAASFGKAWIAHGGAIVNSATYQADKNFSSDAQTLLANAPSDHAALFLIGSAIDARALVPIIRNQPVPVAIYALPVVYSGVPNMAANAVLNGLIFPSTAWQLDAQSTDRTAFADLYPDASEDELRLYGFGMDAFALSRYYLMHNSFEGLNQQGFSGQLTLGDKGVIERQLVWATFIAGVSQRLGN